MSIFWIDYGFLRTVVMTISALSLSLNSDNSNSTMTNLCKAIGNGEQDLAKEIWGRIQFPLSENNSFHKYWITEILHNAIPNKNMAEASQMIKQATAFIHLSDLRGSNKAEAYAKTFLLMKQHGMVFNDDEVFFLGKCAADDKVEQEVVTFETGNGTLEDMLGPVVLHILREKTIFLRNANDDSYLYLGQDEVLLWKSPKFINKAQAIFKFKTGILSNGTAPQVVFSILSTFPKTGNAISTMTYDSEKDKLRIDTIAGKNSTVKEGSWKLHFINNTETVEIRNEKQGKLLCAPLGLQSQYCIDNLRCRPVMLSLSTSNKESCSWKIITKVD